MANKAKPGVEDGEKQSPTDLQEIQLQMNATTDEVCDLADDNNKCVSKTHIRNTGVQLKLCATPRPLSRAVR